jgi:hypothetical protein
MQSILKEIVLSNIIINGSSFNKYKVTNHNYQHEMNTKHIKRMYIYT